MIETEKYTEQLKRWPAAGKHILAQYDLETVTVYQAYRPGIGRHAASHQKFGGEFSFSRMSWIKPNFLWMMYRSNWGTKEGQEITLAIKMLRTGFEQILRTAVHANYMPEIYDARENWKARMAESPVRLQWDPDHDPSGAKQERRAIQLGLGNDILRRYAEEWIVSIEDVSNFVADQRAWAGSNGFVNLITPREEVYPIDNPELAQHLGIGIN